MKAPALAHQAVAYAFRSGQLVQLGFFLDQLQFEACHPLIGRRIARENRIHPQHDAVLRYIRGEGGSGQDLGFRGSRGRLAATGAPSRVALAMSFPEFAARAIRRARKPAEPARLSERIAYGAARFVTVRQLDAPSGPDADITAAERALQDGDIAAALKRLERLPPAAQEALAPWRIGAERRAEIDRAVAALRARAQREAAQEGPST